MKPNKKASANPQKKIKYMADYQLNWASLVPIERRYQLRKIDFLSIAGDAPKDFIIDREYRPGYRPRRERRVGYVAKVGSKFYPNESITEHLITRLGQVFGLRIADSKLRMVGGQMRFMSKYFLNRHAEQLTHGAEIFEYCLGKHNYAALADQRAENRFFTFQMVCEAIQSIETFKGYEESIISGFVEMLTFDALIGHNDRHPYNWAVVVPLTKKCPPRFSPVFDTARALFWNKQERHLMQMLTDNHQLETYIKRCQPPIRWDGELNVDYFRLIGLIWNGYVQYRSNIEKFVVESKLNECNEMIDKEFCLLMSASRCELIKRCLMLRQHHLYRAVAKFKEREGQ